MVDQLVGSIQNSIKLDDMLRQITQVEVVHGLVVYNISWHDCENDV